MELKFVVLVVYASKTGNVTRFIAKLPHQFITLQLKTGEECITDPCVLITYTTGIGEVPAEVLRFCQRHHKLIVAVVASGNRNWGSAYGIAADKISHVFNIPVLMKFELSGTTNDVQKFLRGVEQLEIS